MAIFSGHTGDWQKFVENNSGIDPSLEKESYSNFST